MNKRQIVTFWTCVNVAAVVLGAIVGTLIWRAVSG